MMALCAIAAQIWRPLKEPVHAAQLALLDAATLDMQDLIPVTGHSQRGSLRQYLVAHNPQHR